MSYDTDNNHVVVGVYYHTSSAYVIFSPNENLYCMTMYTITYLVSEIIAYNS